MGEIFPFPAECVSNTSQSIFSSFHRQEKTPTSLTEVSGTIAEMKSVFKKIRGKKSDEDNGNKQDSKAERQPSLLATALQNMNLSSGSSPDQTQPASSQPALSGSTTTLPQTANIAPPPVNKLNARGPTLLGELSAILASPASSYTMGNPRDLIQINLPRPEFNIPAGATVGKIEPEKSEELLESAKCGCLYCTMIQTALGAVHPGWESEKSFIHIFLAPDLPVFVRLQFGTTGTVNLEREEATSLLSIEIPEGQQMTFIITLEDPSKPAIDVEIY
jgi:hypothetical protein